ncbi:MAG: hypothetical protein HY244_03505 [Rhizobiales bacterium]|nr:hypothetical protein [Hyphomicrobiales bacterium]
MYRGLLLVLSLVLGAPATAGAETVAQTLRQFGLLGTWADDCSQPAASNNFHTVYRALPNGNVERTYYNAPGKIYNQYVLSRVNRVSADQVFYSQKGGAGRIDVVLIVADNRYHVLSSQNQNGIVYVRDGRFTEHAGDGKSAGLESPWQTKCHD